MILQCVLILLSYVVKIKGEVVDGHFSKCGGFFYHRSPPRGFEHNEQKSICQRYQNGYHFASLYSTEFRIPIYSAYTLDTFSCPSGQPTRRSRWFIEPQLTGTGLRDMTTEGSLSNTYKRVQAINIDYPNTNYDRGHLNPNFYQCGESRTATFTLTNAVPQDPCFNQQIWKDMEEMAKNAMQIHCNFAGAKRYFVTGAVPSNRKIPSPLHDKEGDQPRDYNRVSVPSAMWTAACCDSSAAHRAQDRNKGFSFGYYGKNIPDSWVIPYTVDQLERQLSRDFRINTLEIFADTCYSSSDTSKTVLSMLAVPVERKVAETLASMSESSESSVRPAKRRFVDSVNSNLHSNKAIAMKNWRFADADFGLIEKRNNIQNTRHLLAASSMTTVLSCPSFLKAKLPSSSEPHYSTKLVDGNSNNQPNEGHPNAAEHEIVPEKPTQLPSSSELHFSTKLADDNSNDEPNEGQPYVIEQEIVHEKAAVDTEWLSGNNNDEYMVVPTLDSTISATTSRCRQGHPCDYHGKKYKWCYTDWSNNWDYCCNGPCGFEQKTSYSWCYTSPSKKWAYCSERSSMISISGRKCRADHECGTHSKGYHWCYTDTNDNWEYCCQPWHECDNHGESYKWCYTGYKKKAKWQKCKY